MARAKRLFACELGASPNVAVAAARTYKKILLELSPLIGIAGVQALFTRSLKRTKLDHPCLEGFTIPAEQIQSLEDLATELQDCLQKQEPELALRSAEALFGHFFSLVATFIGDDLTAQILQGAWPETPSPRERKR